MIEIDGIFEGGGAKGTAYAGVLVQCQKMGIWFKRVAGSSAGAITAALIAAGYKAYNDEDQVIAPSAANDIKSIVYNTDFDRFKDKSIFAFYSLFARSGFYKGIAFMEWMEKILEARLGILKPKFSDLPLDLTVLASDITNQRFLILNKITTPNLRVAEAVRMSMSIPFFFRVYKWKGDGIYASNTTMRVVDGGLLSNYPVWLFDEDNEYVQNTDEEKKRPTVGFLLVEKPDEEIDGEPAPMDEGIAYRKAPEKHKLSFIDLVKAIPLVQDLGFIINTLLTAHDNKYIKKSKWENTIPIFVNSYGTTQFDLTTSQKDDLAYRGQRAVERKMPEICQKYGF